MSTPTPIYNPQAELKIHRLTQAQYDALPEHSDSEIWIITDALEGYYDVMPEPIAAYVGLMTLYIGETDDHFITGYTYKCVEDTSTTPSTYKWVQVTHDPIIIRTWEEPVEE